MSAPVAPPRVSEADEEALFERLRSNALTLEDCRWLLAEELAARRPCPDLIAATRADIARFEGDE